MRHGKKLNKLSRTAEHRKALINNLAMALITNKQIQTTDAKAKVLKPYIDRLISTARQNTLNARRLVAKSLPNKAAYKELFENIVPKLEGRTSGFSRIVKHKARKGDGAAMSIIQLLLEEEVESKGKKKSKKKTAPKETPAAKKDKPKEEKLEAEAKEEPEPKETEEAVEDSSPEPEAEKPEGGEDKKE